MRVSLDLLAVAGVFVAGILIPAHAAPLINVAVQASFPSPPFLINLLETAAGENATAYFSLLDRIADGWFDSATTDERLYNAFRSILKQDGHLSRPEDLASFDLALALNSAAPRIEAHYQFYNTSVHPWLPEEEGAQSQCESWIYSPLDGKRSCSVTQEESERQVVGEPEEKIHALPFDRILGHNSQKSSILYADITSRPFRKLYKNLREAAVTGQSSFRVRYRPSTGQLVRPLLVSGYGVEMALKRTDYIVIDDRQAEAQSKSSDAKKKTDANEEDLADLRPLSSSELSRLGLKAATFVMASKKPLDALAELLEDFPKRSSAISKVDVSMEFVREHRENRAVLLPAGHNALWINGVQMVNRDIDAYALVEHLRHERGMIESVRKQGLNPRQAISLLSNEAVMQSQMSTSVQRYDWRDDVEGGNVIMWLNDLEKDPMYAAWPATLQAILQRMFPGQLPSVRRDMHNLIIPVDLASATDVALIVENLQNFVKRGIPIRFGIVPVTSTSSASKKQAKAVYELLKTYGPDATFAYLQSSLASDGRKFGEPNSKSWQDARLAVAVENVDMDDSSPTLDQITSDDKNNDQIEAASAYLDRLGANMANGPVFANGVAIPHSEEWLQLMSQQFSQDLQFLQHGVYTETITEDTWVPSLWLESASLRRNPLIIPEEDKNLVHIRLDQHSQIEMLPAVPASKDTVDAELAHLIVVADLTTNEGIEQILKAILFRREHDNVELAILHLSDGIATRGLGTGLAKARGLSYLKDLGQVFDSTLRKKFPDAKGSSVDSIEAIERDRLFTTVVDEFRGVAGLNIDFEKIDEYWDEYQGLLSAVGVRNGQHAVILNGRVVGPFDKNEKLEVEDFDTLLAYERKRRLLPAAKAIQNLDLGDSAANPIAFARISNLIALSQLSDVPEGIFEPASTVRTENFNKWNSSKSAIVLGDIDTAMIQIVASIDPASELAQRWVPIIKTLSQLDGVHLRLFLNPKDRLEELPIKRFYRHVLQPRLTFDADGAIEGQSARFSGLPADALLNVGMDLPPSWLVAPAVSIHDLDNIKLSAVKTGQDIEATYELEHILIEGHSRESIGEQEKSGPAPRGAQLVLGTRSDPHIADTIIMANLGYFQFKANPGVYQLAMQKGRSEEIFDIISTGNLGYNPRPGDNGTEVALLSFRGTTLFPRIARKPGKEDDDVLESAPSTFESIADNADKLLAKAGLPSKGASKYLSQAAKLGSKLFSGSMKSSDAAAQQHADINIFSVASGHLYERMLNIMMVSVMKHTNHTVKFWFIEQFLSPSFKTFLPTLAAEYGFRYEMVTYKWPHWLRGQKEKQREIWGYKILFLDVLFPLDLDKVIFVDADQIVRTDMYDLIQHDLQGAPYGFTPMCDSRTEMEGFRFWKQGYWKNFLKGLPYHISALYVVDLKEFRRIAAGDRLRQQYHQLSADPNSLSNLDQDLPNNMQMSIPIHSLPQDWLWCETWCSDEALKTAKTIDLCNNPQTKEPKLDRARRQVPEWTVYDDEIATVAKRHQQSAAAAGRPISGDASDAGPQGKAEESIQERLQREDAEKERKFKGHEEL